MCLTLVETFETREKAREFFKNPKIAKKNITVYKGLGGSGLSPHKYFRYEKGMHYYQDGKPFTVVINRNYLDQWKVNIHQGLHSCKTYGRATHHGSRVEKMVIPKGSKYFENDNDYVSDNLIWY